ncbi:hypothetical protein [Dyadobacter sediminis]|uniref:Hint domain-containing protein n=1 Tax=Dyadobacter sediminis TaxID=1493691 RepID=A0A5R9KEN3_9BACT|nr:hypothetical protein [Dyadobacter sediminis]TLU94605.1 hypothetical protein FEM55_10260 [Dyadobacter sediminis]GGB89802.1 hypothetical protein GCM10011325_16570 [Dyadobacter sediminis]
MRKVSVFTTLLVLFFSLLAAPVTKAANFRSEPFHFLKKHKGGRFFSANAAVTMADGSIKRIADIRAGEHVQTCKRGKSNTTEVKHVNVYDKPASALTAVYLKPAGKKTDQQTMVPAILLEAAPQHYVQTRHGKKRMSKLSKNDILYRYEPLTGMASSWKVGAIQENARKVNKAYNLETADGTFLVGNVVIANN